MIGQQTTPLHQRDMNQQSEQLSFDLAGLDLNPPLSGELGRGQNGSANKLDVQDRAFHDWYRFVLSYPPHLVRTYLQDFGLDERHTVIDPFCGTGTTVVECKLNRVKGVGLEANPFAHFASTVKLDWDIDPGALEAMGQDVAAVTWQALEAQGIKDNEPFSDSVQGTALRSLDPEAMALLLKGSISPLPLHKALVLLDHLRLHQEESHYRHGLLALANALVFKISNLHFGPEVGVQSPKRDVPVVASWLHEIRKMADDLRQVHGQPYQACRVQHADARRIADILAPRSIDAVITSPPYPNEKDYTRTTRLESVMLGFINNKAELRALKQQMVRSNTRGVYKDDDDDQWIARHPEIQSIADAIEQRRVEMGKTSGFERLYPKVTKLYFGGMARHLAELREVLRPGAQLAYVVGDQASYLRVMIRTGQLIADIAQSLGYEVVRIDLFRTRLATATREQLREEVVVLRWRGGSG
jgi:DNA modification methylase